MKQCRFAAAMALAASLCAGSLPMAAHAAGAAPGSVEACDRPFYPLRSVESREAGVSYVAFLVGADGKVGRTVLLSSSGSALMDQFGMDAVAACEVKPRTRGGEAVPSWRGVRYAWVLEDDPAMKTAMARAARAAGKGDVDALFQLYLLLDSRAKTDAERVQALVVLNSAAEGGNATAQYEMGNHVEHGKLVQADHDEALRWYRRAAEQGNVLALDRLARSAPPAEDEKKAAP